MRTRIVIQRAEERLRLHQTVGQILQRAGIQIEQAAAAEVGIGFGGEHLREQFWIGLQLRHQAALGVVGDLGAAAVDHHHQIAAAGEQLVHLQLGLAPGQFGRQHVLIVGIDAQVRRHVVQQAGAEQQCQQQDCQRMALHPGDPGAGQARGKPGGLIGG